MHKGGREAVFYFRYIKCHCILHFKVDNHRFVG